MARPAARRPHLRRTRRAPQGGPHPGEDQQLLSPTFRALSNPNYRLYLAGSVVSNTGTWMMRVAQDWLVLKPLDGGGTAVGITTGLQFLPVLLLTPYAGVLADRMPKRRLLQITQAAMGLFSLLSA